MTRTALIIGGSGQIGRAAAARLCDSGWSVRVADRGRRELPAELQGRRLERVRIDRNLPGSLERAIGRSTELLVDTVAYGPEHARQLLSLSGRVGAMVVISSAAVYADRVGRSLEDADEAGFPELPVPIAESQSTVQACGRTYAHRKAAMEQLLLAQDKLDLTVIRPCAVHGPGSRSPREWYFLKRVLDRRAVIPLAYEGINVFHTTSVDNLAELIRVAAERPGRRALNSGDPDPPSVRAIAAAVLQWAGHDARVVALPGPPPAPGVGDTPWSAPSPFVLDMEAAHALGYRPVVGYREALAQTCAWLCAATRGRDWQAVLPGLASYGPHLFDYAAEDEHVARLEGD